MIKIHPLQNGDSIKMLPFINKDDKIDWIKPYDAVFIDGKIIYDNSGKNYLRRISHKLKQSNSNIKLTTQTRYALNIYICGEIRILNIGLSLFEIIKNNRELMDIKGDHQIVIVEEKVNVGGGQVFPNWKNSYVSRKRWKPPVSDINSKEEWYSYIKSNQPDFDKHIENNNIFNKKQLLIDKLGVDMLSEFIADDRQKKLDIIGI